MIKTVALCLFFGLPVAAAGQALVSVTYLFDGETLAPTISGPGFTASNFGYSGNATSPGFSSSGHPGDAYHATHWDSPGDYYSFTVAQIEGFSFTTATFSFDARLTPSGPDVISLRASADDFGTALLNFENGAGNLFDTYGAELTSITTTSPLEFRIFGDGATHHLGNFRIDNVTVTGTVSAVPEPSAYAAMVGVLVFGFLLWTRRRVTAQHAS